VADVGGETGFDLLHTVKLDNKNFNHVWNLDYTYEGKTEKVRSLIDLNDRGTLEKADLALKALVSQDNHIK
jgi:hypothetical protein